MNTLVSEYEMKTVNLEPDIIGVALAQLEFITGIRTQILGRKHANDRRTGDAEVAIDGNQYTAAIKRRITNAELGVLQTIQAAYTGKYLFITGYVTPQVAERLRGMDIQFLDIAGNAYINAPPFFIFIQGNKRIDETGFKQVRRAFYPTGLKVLYALLCMPGFEKENYRKIADHADVAIGTVNWVMRDLRELGYLQDRGRYGRKLIKKEDLLVKWITTYPEKLRVKQHLGRYTPNLDKKQFFNIEQPEINIDGYWGGEPAAAILTKRYLKPKIITIYTWAPLDRFLAKHRLRRDINGDIELLRPFWKFNLPFENRMIVNPILIYADLMATGDDRNLEAAEILRQNEIIEYIQ